MHVGGWAWPTCSLAIDMDVSSLNINYAMRRCGRSLSSIRPAFLTGVTLKIDVWMAYIIHDRQLLSYFAIKLVLCKIAKALVYYNSPGDSTVM